MRVNVYTEELERGEANDPLKAEIVTACYISSRTKRAMTNYGLRIYLKSSPALHFIPGRDDDRSAITFWCGEKESHVFAFLAMLQDMANQSTLKLWREKTEKQVAEANEAEVQRAKARIAKGSDDAPAAAMTLDTLANAKAMLKEQGDSHKAPYSGTGFDT